MLLFCSSGFSFPASQLYCFSVFCAFVFLLFLVFCFSVFFGFSTFFSFAFLLASLFLSFITSSTAQGGGESFKDRTLKER